MEEDIFTYDIFGEEFESTWMVEISILWKARRAFSVLAVKRALTMTIC